MGRPQITFTKRQREQAKRERQQQKAARRADRKTDKPSEESLIDSEVVMETPEAPEAPTDTVS